MRRRRAIATALILCCTAAVAQEDTLLERFYHRASVDTSYVVRPTTRWTLKGRFLLSHNNLTTNGLHNGATIALPRGLHPVVHPAPELRKPAGRRHHRGALPDTGRQHHRRAALQLFLYQTGSGTGLWLQLCARRRMAAAPLGPALPHHQQPETLRGQRHRSGAYQPPRRVRHRGARGGGVSVWEDFCRTEPRVQLHQHQRSRRDGHHQHPLATDG